MRLSSLMPTREGWEDRVGVVRERTVDVEFGTRRGMMSTESPIVGRLYVNGIWSTPRADFASQNPANLAEAVGNFPTATAPEARAAVASARTAYPEWRRTSRIYRAECF